ncbi:MAG TPA: hypothetical protein VMU39_25215 [Solirubrobacteraceae bacterium]|nr:hypothetical protein [Solirubrobacteraceae bacterium]
MIDALTVTLTALGFQPIVTQRLKDQLTICLRNCPDRRRACRTQGQDATVARHLMQHAPDRRAR